MTSQRDAVRQLRKIGAEIFKAEDGRVALVQLPNGRQYTSAADALSAWMWGGAGISVVGSAAVLMLPNTVSSWKSKDPQFTSTMSAPSPPEMPVGQMLEPTVRRLRVGETDG